MAYMHELVKMHVLDYTTDTLWAYKATDLNPICLHNSNFE